jgi:plasmid replication initiation protein
LSTKIALVEQQNSKHKITMSNALTRAGHGLSLSEKRMVFIAISKIDSRKPLPLPLNQHGIYTSRITAAEYAELAECEIQTAYQALKEASKALYSRSITFFEPAYKRKGDLVQSHMRWVGKVQYHDKEGWAELFWWPEVLPHLSNQTVHFSSYQLKQVSALRSNYSWKLLELLNRFKKEGWAYYTVEDFATSMEVPPSLNDFGQITRRVIKPAVKELTEKDGWVITWEAIKAGRKVKAVRFEFRRDEQIPMPLTGGELPKKPRKGKVKITAPF